MSWKLLTGNVNVHSTFFLVKEESKAIASYLSLTQSQYSGCKLGAIQSAQRPFVDLPLTIRLRGGKFSASTFWCPFSNLADIAGGKFLNVESLKKPPGQQ